MKKIVSVVLAIIMCMTVGCSVAEDVSLIKLFLLQICNRLLKWQSGLI